MTLIVSKESLARDTHTDTASSMLTFSRLWKRKGRRIFQIEPFVSKRDRTVSDDAIREKALIYIPLCPFWRSQGCLKIIIINMSYGVLLWLWVNWTQYALFVNSSILKISFTLSVFDHLFEIQNCYAVASFGVLEVNLHTLLWHVCLFEKTKTRQKAVLLNMTFCCSDYLFLSVYCMSVRNPIPVMNEARTLCSRCCHYSMDIISLNWWSLGLCHSTW